MYSKRMSVVSVAESTVSNKSDLSAFSGISGVSRASMQQRKSLFNDGRKRRQSIGAYTSLFLRKLLPPIGFYREVDKYNEMKQKFAGDPDKLEILDEMWNDYQKYQIRKRFKWPPKLFFQNFFWSTGYYPDYLKLSRATKLRKPGEDSSDEEFFDPLGQFNVIAGTEDVNVEEFERYREAKKKNRNRGANANKKRMTRFHDESDLNNPDMERRSTMSRLFEDDNQSLYSVQSGGDDNSQSKKNKKRKSKKKDKKEPQELEEVETTVEVEYTLIKDPNKKKKRDKNKGEVISASVPNIPGLSTEEAAALQKVYEQSVAGNNEKPQKVISKRKSVAKVMVDDTGKKIVDVEETEQSIGGEIKVTRNIAVADDDLLPVRHSLTTLSTIWDTDDKSLKKQYSTHTLIVTNLPDKVSIKAMSQLFPSAKVNLKTPKKPGQQPYATVRFADAELCKKMFIENRNVVLDGKKLVVNPKVRG